MRNKMMMVLSVKLEELPTEDKIASLGTETNKIITNTISGITVRDLNNEDKNYKISNGVLVTKLNEIFINNKYFLS